MWQNLQAMLRWFHLIFGLIVFIIFLITGQLMYGYWPDKELISPEFRLLTRSRHIYIIFSALIHVALGLYLSIHPQKWRSVMQFAGSMVLTAASVVLIWAFFLESFQMQKFSELSRLGIYLSLGGVAFHAIGGILLKSK